MFIAKRYAQAFLNLYTLHIADIEAIKQAIHFFDEHAEVFSLLKVPLLGDHIKTQALQDYLLDRFKLPSSFAKLIEIIIAHKRSYLIVDILEQIIVLYQEQQGIETFVIKSSFGLEEQDVPVLKNFLAERTGHTIIAQVIHDPGLIAGIRMQSAHHLWEYSIAKQMMRVQNQIMV